MKKYYTINEAISELEVSRTDFNKAVAHLGVSKLKHGTGLKITSENLDKLDKFFSSKHEIQP